MKFFLFFFLLLIPFASAFVIPENVCEEFLLDLNGVLNYSAQELQELSDEVCVRHNETIVINETVVLNHTEVVNRTIVQNHTRVVNRTVNHTFVLSPPEGASVEEESDFFQEVMQLVLLKQLGLSEGAPVQNSNSSSSSDVVGVLRRVEGLERELRQAREQPVQEETDYSFLFFLGVLGLAGAGVVYHFRHKIFPSEQVSEAPFVPSRELYPELHDIPEPQTYPSEDKKGGDARGGG